MRPGPSRRAAASLAAAGFLAAVPAGPARAQEDPWAPEPEAPEAPAPAALPSWPPHAPFGVHLVAGLQVEGRLGLTAGFGLRIHRAVLSYRWWVHDGGDEGSQYTTFGGVEAGWFVWPRDWGGVHVSAAIGGLEYRVLDHYVDGSAAYVPSLTAHGTALELEVGILGFAGGFTNAAGVSVAVLIPLDPPSLPAGVDLAPPVVFLRLDLNPLLVLAAR